MEKPTQNPEQERPKTLEDYAVATFHADADPDITTSPLTVIRSGEDGKSVRYDGGWIPGDMLSVCDTDSEEGISEPELFLRVHKPVKVNGEYVVAERIVALSRLQSREANKGFNESYIQELYGKSTEEMIEEGKRAAEQIWRQKHPDSEWNELLDVKASPETPSDDLDTEDNSEKSLNDEVSLAMRSLAVKTVEVSPVKTNEIGIDSPVLKIPESTMELIRVTEVNGSVGLPAVKPDEKPVEIDKVGANLADLVAAEPVKKLVEADKASAAPADLPAVESAKNPVETNEANAGILPESFKSVINNFEKYTKGNNGEFLTKVDKNLRLNLDQLQLQIQRNPEVIKEPATEEFMRRASSMIIYLEASRAKAANEFKNNMDSLLEGLESKIENDDERRRLVELTEHVDQMGTDNRVLGDVTNTLLNELTIIINNIEKSRNDRGGIIHYKSTIAQSINKIINSDLGSVYGRRQSILDAIKGIRKAGY